MESTIQVDAFNTNLHGCRILCQGPFPNDKQAPIMDSIQKLREPFKRKILITKNTFSFSKYMKLQYDSVFQLKESVDWSLILTYLTYSPKPTLVVIEDVQIPDAFWGKITRTTTVVHITAANNANFRAYDAIFFAPIEELFSNYAETVFKQLQTLYRSNYTQKEYKEILQELRIAGAGLAWTRHQEQLSSGSLYWYDPVTSNSGDGLSAKQLSELFTWLSEQFNKNADDNE
jgi:hypothetical protein